jgi:deoxyribodipyrimidine photolyase-related protein
VAQAIAAVCAETGTPLRVEQDRHFLTSHAEFAAWAQGRRQWVMEHFYRDARRRSGYLMSDGHPIGGQWNLDRENRRSFGRQGPGLLPPPFSVTPDAGTRAVIRLVEQRFPHHPGDLSRFDWPVTRPQALAALEDFVGTRLAAFGTYQDAMWSGQPWLHHSRLAPALNLKLLDPREVLDAVAAAYAAGHVPLNSAEGFVRQVLGWREYVRHVYWSTMPGLLEQNALEAQQPLPAFYWSADTELHCLHQTLGQTLEYGYAHHIQRLMVTGLFALLLGVQPRRLHEWYLAIYVDAVEWVEAPNTIGMSQFADGGRLASKPYVASGRYIQRMSDYCRHCRYDPGAATGERACPYTVLYWDFLQRHAARFAGHPRTALQWRNLERLDRPTREAIAQGAAALRDRYA